jgi:hypothetical protein
MRQRLFNAGSEVPWAVQHTPHNGTGHGVDEVPLSIWSTPSLPWLWSVRVFYADMAKRRSAQRYFAGSTTSAAHARSRPISSWSRRADLECPVNAFSAAGILFRHPRGWGFRLGPVPILDPALILLAEVQAYRRVCGADLSCPPPVTGSLFQRFHCSVAHRLNSRRHPASP